jgi:hypothetical protein
MRCKTRLGASGQGSIDMRKKCLRLRRAMPALAAAALLALGTLPGTGLAGPADNASGAVVRKRTGAGKSQSRPWTIEDALPDRSKALDTDALPPRPSRGFGSIPWHSGTLSLETKSQVDSHRVPEARRIPSLESDNRNMPSYLGLSLTLPTSKLFAPPKADDTNGSPPD